MKRSALPDLPWLIENRPNVYAAAARHLASIKNGHHSISKAFPKSGKRILKQTIALLTQSDTSLKAVINIYVTSLNRRDTHSQWREMNEYGFILFCAATQINEIEKFVKDKVTKNPHILIIIHHDELDYGSGDKQAFGRVFWRLKKFHQVRFVHYSATPEEVLCSQYGEGCDIIPMIPPKSYCGPHYFLENDLITEPTQFFDVDNDFLTEQGEDAISYWLETNKPLAYVRFATKGMYQHIKDEENCDFINIMRECGVQVYFVDQHTAMYHGKRNDYRHPADPAFAWFNCPKDEKWLLVVNQTFTRSTECGFHPWIAFYHDYRKSTTAYNTAEQAIGRMYHFDYQPDSRYWGDDTTVTTRLYVDRSIVEKDASIISDEEFFEYSGRKLSSRIKNMAERQINHVVIDINDDKLGDIVKRWAALVTPLIESGTDTVRRTGDIVIPFSPSDWERINEHKSVKLIEPGQKWQPKGSDERLIFQMLENKIRCSVAQAGADGGFVYLRDSTTRTRIIKAGESVRSGDRGDFVRHADHQYVRPNFMINLETHQITQVTLPIHTQTIEAGLAPHRSAYGA